MALLELLIAVAFLLGALLALAYGFYWVRAQFSFVERQGRVACPHCAELIQPAAKICRYCQREVGESLNTPKSPRGLFQ